MNGKVNLPIFLLALLIAVTLKFAIHEDEQVSDRLIDAPVTYNPPSDDVVIYRLVDRVKVGLRGRQSAIAQLTVFNVEVLANVPRGQMGPVDINLTPANVRAPQDFEVISLEPNRFTIQVEPRRDATVRIVARLTGEPAAGARHREPIVRPPRAKVTGPESKVRQVLELTAPVRLDGHARTFTDTVLVVSPDPLVRVVEPTFVEVEVPMQEPELSISFEDLSQGSPTR